MSTVFAIGLGIGHKNRQGEWLDTYYPTPITGAISEDLVNAIQKVGYKEGNQTIELNKEQLTTLASIDHEFTELAHHLSTSDQPCALVLIANDAPASTVPEAYLKLHILSHRLVKPHGTDLTGIFGLLPNVAWTNVGPIDLDELQDRQLSARLNGHIVEVNSVDKFPRMSDYIIPSGVRVADTSRVRLGAYLGEGTTIMHEGFVNFNAGTEGPGMVEGRISAGVLIGAGSDLGGGCSTMGTLSGGGNVIISVGKECLIGANAGIGIPLGDRCTVEAGLYITAGTKVTLIDQTQGETGTTKASALAGMNDLLFRRNSLNGRVECLSNSAKFSLNEELHANN